MRVQKLDRIFDSYDVVVVRVIDQVDDGSEGRTLAAAGWPSHQDDAVLDVGDLRELGRKIEIAERGRAHRNHAHDDRVCATLFENIDAETSVARRAE